MSVSIPTVLIVAAPTLFRQGLVTLFRERWPQLLLTLTTDAAQVVELLAQRPFELVAVDCSLLGKHLPELLQSLHRAQPRQHLLLLADQHPSEEPTSPIPWPDTRLHLPRHLPPPTLVAALAPWLDAAPAAPVAPHPASDFSPREREVLRLVVADHCNEEIADRLCLSVRTVESHRRALLHKAGTRTLVGLAARAVREGWVA